MHTSAYCDSCMCDIVGLRILCLDCMDNETQGTVDFCNTPTCMIKRIDRGDLEPHLPTHDMIKVHRRLHKRHKGVAVYDAKAALKKSRVIFNDLQSSENKALEDGVLNFIADGKQASAAPAIQDVDSEKDGVTCAVCKKILTQPCWFCVHCLGKCRSAMTSEVMFVYWRASVKDPTFFCSDCEAKGFNIKPSNHHYIHKLLAIKPPLIDPNVTCTECGTEDSSIFVNHDETHDLVWCQKLVEDATLSTEIRLANLEAAMDKKLAQLESEVGTRLTRVENLLEALLGKLGVPSVEPR